MARPTGVRNRDFGEKRLALVEKLTDFVLNDDVDLPSFRQLAIAARVSEPTLRHYFTNRSGVIVAIFKHLYKNSLSTLEATRQPGSDLGQALEEYHQLLVQLMNNKAFIRSHAFGMREGLSDEAVRESYLEYLVEPAIDALAERLVKTKGGPQSFETAKATARMLSSSSSMLIVHQELLGGKVHVPMEQEAYLTLVRNWMKDGVVTNPEGSGDQP